MNSLKKQLASLLMLTLIPSTKVIAAKETYGIKVGISNCFTTLSDKYKKEVVQKAASYLFKTQEKPEINTKMWHPWFGIALYSGCPINDHIGFELEVLYQRFNQSFRMVCSKETVGSIDRTEHIDTVGLTLRCIWYWTGSIRPDFKDDYFIGSLFAGPYCFNVMSRVAEIQESTTKNGEQSSHNQSIETSLTHKDRLKVGFIAGTSVELPIGLLFEAKAILPYNLSNTKDEHKELRSSFTSIDLSLGFNVAKLC